VRAGGRAARQAAEVQRGRPAFVLQPCDVGGPRGVDGDAGLVTRADRERSGGAGAGGREHQNGERGGEGHAGTAGHDVSPLQLRTSTLPRSWSGPQAPAGTSSAGPDPPMRGGGHPPLRGHLRPVVRARRHRGPADGPRRALVRAARRSPPSGPTVTRSSRSRCARSCAATPARRSARKR
jgi:hypothetical protein